MLSEARSTIADNALPSLNGARLLVVDNDPDTQYLFTLIFEEKGATVTAVNCVQAAIAAMAQVKPDLLISALSLPGEDGYSLIGKVRHLEAEQGGTIPAIAVTTLPKKLACSDALRTGFQHYLVKPVDIDELIEAAMSLTGRNTELKCTH